MLLILGLFQLGMPAHQGAVVSRDDILASDEAQQTPVVFPGHHWNTAYLAIGACRNCFICVDIHLNSNVWLIMVSSGSREGNRCSNPSCADGDGLSLDGRLNQAIVAVITAVNNVNLLALPVEEHKKVMAY